VSARGDVEQAIAGGLKKPYSLADARRIAEALNLRWGRFGVERFEPANNEESEKDGPVQPEEGPALVEGVA
jgi:hypothetical protein